MAEVSKRQRADEFAMNPSFLKTLCHSKVEDLQPSSGVVFFANREDNLAEVYKGLIKYNFSSVPVIQKTKNKWYGFVDLSDITSCIVEIFGRQRLETNEDFWKAMATEELFQKKKVKDIMQYPLSLRNPFHPICKGYSLLSAIELLAREENLHRIPVIEDFKSRKLVNIITQSQVITYLCNHLDQLGAIKEKPLSSIAIVHKKVVKFNQEEIALEAFKTLHYLDITGGAVVDNDGKIVGAITLSDLKLIQSDGRMFFRLYQPIKSFLHKSLNEEIPRPRNPVIASENETIGSALKKLDKNHVHRLFIVDKEHRPVGVVALRDILLELVNC